jgi:Putative restriction endonuclease
MSLPEALKLTYEDYAVLPEDRRYEVIDGDLFAMPSQTLFHQTVLLRLTRLLADFVEQRDLGVVLAGPIDVVLSRYDVVQPDAFYVSKERRPILGEKYIAGAPDLIIEVLLPESEIHDHSGGLSPQSALRAGGYGSLDRTSRTRNRTGAHFRAHPGGARDNRDSEGRGGEWNFRDDCACRTEVHLRGLLPPPRGPASRGH